MKKYKIALLILLLTITANAQTNIRPCWDFDIKLGLNIGGYSPLPLPEEIREIKSYSPTIAPTIEADVTLWLGADKRWGVSSGVKYENKAMSTKARVKNYSTEIIGENNNKLKGFWTGSVHTKVNNDYLTIPLLAAFRASNRINVKAGLFASFLLDGGFSGYVYDGYLRKDTPTGDKIEFANDTKGVYDFSENMRKFIWGLQAGADWKVANHIKIFADLTWGVNDIKESSFRTVSFSMYPIYLNIGCGYCF